MKERNAILMEEKTLEQVSGGDVYRRNTRIVVVDYRGLIIHKDVMISLKWSGNALKREISRLLNWDLNEFDLYYYDTRLKYNQTVEANGIHYGDRIDARPVK